MEEPLLGKLGCWRFEENSVGGGKRGGVSSDVRKQKKFLEGHPSW